MLTAQRPHETTWEQTILEHLRRYRLSVPEALLRTVGGRPGKRPVLQRTLSRLERAGLVRTAPLYGQHKYWALTAAGWAGLGGDLPVEPLAGTPFSETAKLRQYGLLSFCCLGSIPRRRLLAEELPPRANQPAHAGQAANYYIETTNAAPRLGWRRIDSSGHGRWDRVLATVLHDAAQHAVDDRFRALIDAGLFEITLATALRPKALRLGQALAESDPPPALPIRIVVIPELLSLIAPPPH